MRIRRLLVANRGEIALRIVRAARSLGIETVLAASAADRDSAAAREADRTVVLGPGLPRRSYLDMNVVAHAALATGCDALHPGYGFLSERSEFARLCESAGLIYVGPAPESIERVGGKIAARELARSVGVPLVEGSGAVGSVQEALAIAERIGYPVVTKASAGGGGRGMVVARSPEELGASFDRASSEAREAFGDGTLFLEHYVQKARHIEVQALGDGRGTVLHFGERDCSAQRRYQKMVEEAPAAVLPQPVREQLHAAACSLLAEIRYRNAGTVEFLYDVEREQFFFMEVNARIQVEHPVSEEVTDTDLIRLQLLVAAGEPLPVAQPDITVRGHAIEVRVLAEDPRRSFAPSPGRITRWQAPGGLGVRLDTAMFEGALVPPFYDSMIAKLIVRGANRAEAVRRLGDALDGFAVDGVATNIDLLRHIVRHPDYVSNRITTRWLEQVLLPSYETAIGA